MKRKSMITKLCGLLLAVTLLPMWANSTIAAQTGELAVPMSTIPDMQVQEGEESKSIAVSQWLTQEVLWDVLGPISTSSQMHWADLDYQLGGMISHTEIIPFSSYVTIVYHGNGNTDGSAPASQMVVTPGTVTVSSPGTLTKTGYIFGGWRDTYTGNVIAAGQLVGWSIAVTATAAPPESPCRN